MPNTKSPGPDGMNPLFYKQYWTIIGRNVLHAVQHFFQGGRINRAANHTFLTLIPKRKAAHRVEQFRPIALCNVIYKVITKILATRIKPYLNQIIHPTQSAFIPSRSIVENCIINHELMWYMKSRRGKTGYLAIKVDMSKAYDMVEWDVLEAVLIAHGFGPAFCNMVMECITSAQFSVLINGSPCGFFSSSRGIRQGDPISPALFVLLSDILSRITSRAEMEGKITGIKVSRTSPRITRLMYADDLVIYCKANMEEVTEVKRCLDSYCLWTGQQINWEKSEVHFSPNVPRFQKHHVCRFLGMKECGHSSKYLGSPFCKFTAKNSDFAYVAERLVSKLSGWKSKLLSIAGRVTLIKSVTSAIPSYIMQLFLLPLNFCVKLDRFNRRFLWGIKEDRSRYSALRAWDSVFQNVQGVLAFDGLKISTRPSSQSLVGNYVPLLIKLG